MVAEAPLVPAPSTAKVMSPVCCTTGTIEPKFVGLTGPPVPGVSDGVIRSSSCSTLNGLERRIVFVFWGFSKERIRWAADLKGYDMERLRGCGLNAKKD